MGNCLVKTKIDNTSEHIINRKIDEVSYEQDIINKIVSIEPVNPFVKEKISKNWNETMCIETFPCKHWVYIQLNTGEKFYSILNAKQIIRWFQLKSQPIPNHFCRN